MSLKKLKMWFLNILDRAYVFFRKLIGRPVQELDLTKTSMFEKVKPGRKWYDFPFKKIVTSRGLLNMPKRQPCPRCRHMCKRSRKMASGARYTCAVHGVFFVGASREQIREKRKQQRAKHGKSRDKAQTVRHNQIPATP